MQFAAPTTELNHGGGAVPRTRLVHNTRSMNSRLIIALALSFVLHGGLLLNGLVGQPRPPTAPALQAVLRRPPDSLPEPSTPTPDTLLKNTLGEDPALRPSPPRKEPVAPEPQKQARPRTPERAPTPAVRQEAALRRQLSKHVFYPREAVERGLEGEVLLSLTLAADGSIDDVRVEHGSGHAILDDAAVRAAWAMGRVAAERSRLTLPVVFRLQ